MLSPAPSALSLVAPVSSSIRQKSQIPTNLTSKLHVEAKLPELLMVILSA